MADTTPTQPEHPLARTLRMLALAMIDPVHNRIRETSMFRAIEGALVDLPVVAKEIQDQRRALLQAGVVVRAYVYNGHTATSVAAGAHARDGFCPTCSDQYELGQEMMKEIEKLIQFDASPPRARIPMVDDPLPDARCEECDHLISQHDHTGCFCDCSMKYPKKPADAPVAAAQPPRCADCGCAKAWHPPEEAGTKPCNYEDMDGERSCACKGYVPIAEPRCGLMTNDLSWSGEDTQRHCTLAPHTDQLHRATRPDGTIYEWRVVDAKPDPQWLSSETGTAASGMLMVDDPAPAGPVDREKLAAMWTPPESVRPAGQTAMHQADILGAARKKLAVPLDTTMTPLEMAAQTLQAAMEHCNGRRCGNAPVLAAVGDCVRVAQHDWHTTTLAKAKVMARVDVEAARTERDAIARFKAYVHQRLDEAGIPVNPGGPHSEHGCRVGDRLDIALAGRVRVAPTQEAAGKTEAPPTGRERNEEGNCAKCDRAECPGDCEATPPPSATALEKAIVELEAMDAGNYESAWRRRGAALDLLRTAQREQTELAQARDRFSQAASDNARLLGKAETERDAALAALAGTDAGELMATKRALDGARARVAVLERLATKVDAIRNSIVGMQGFNFSEHAYPLVAALDEAGYPGAGYEIAHKNLGTLIEQAKAAEKERDAALAEVAALKANLGAVTKQLEFDDMEILLKDSTPVVDYKKPGDAVRALLARCGSATRAAITEREQVVAELARVRDGVEAARVAARAEVERLKREIEAVLSVLGSNAVRVREGNGPEDIAASLAVSVAKLKQREEDGCKLYDKLLAKERTEVERLKERLGAEVARCHAAEASLGELVNAVAINLVEDFDHIHAGPSEQRTLTPAAAVETVKRWAENRKTERASRAIGEDGVDAHDCAKLEEDLAFAKAEITTLRAELKDLQDAAAEHECAPFRRAVENVRDLLWLDPPAINLARVRIEDALSHSSAADEVELDRLRGIASAAHRAVCEADGEDELTVAADALDEAHTAVDAQLRKMGRIK